MCTKIARSRTAVVTAHIFIMFAPRVGDKVFEAHGSKKVVLWKVCAARVDAGLSVERVRLTLLQLSVDMQPSAFTEDNRNFLPEMPNQISSVKTDNWTM